VTSSFAEVLNSEEAVVRIGDLGDRPIQGVRHVVIAHQGCDDHAVTTNWRHQRGV
jgi:hypothetical protein